MYTWDSDASDWYGDAKYSYREAGLKKRSEAAEKASTLGPRTYEKKSNPNFKVVDPHKYIETKTQNPLIIAIDVTGSMASWPFEIFDRLPLLYNTLSQYREDLEICFIAVGDGKVDQFPMQATSFANGFDLEQQLGALFGEGGGGDAPESYGLLAHWVNTHVKLHNLQEQPFLIIFGDAPMHPMVEKDQVKAIFGDDITHSYESDTAWQQVTRNWNTWFLRRPTGKAGDFVDKQWGKAIGEQKILHIEDEQRAVDYVMGLIARSWGYFDDFQNNMRARQSEDKVKKLSEIISMVCPKCGAPIPTESSGMFTCPYCGVTLKV